jgi:o-succinylbenzoate synthase
MRIASIEIYRYELPLSGPVVLGPVEFATRSGALVCVTLDNALEAWGEAAPLPHFSAETLDEVIAELQSVVGDWAGRWVNDIPDRYEGSSSVVTALEQVRHELHHAHHIPFPQNRKMVELNGLVTDLTGDAERVAGDLQRAGYRVLKIKVGRGDPEQEARRLRRLSQSLHGEIALRLDANRAWDLPEALAFARGVRGMSIQYLEEPLADPSDIPAFVERTGMPVALDETMRDEDAWRALLPDIRAVVLKPALMGGYARTLEIAREVAERRRLTVLSSAFECGVGMRYLAALAGSNPFAGTPAGLDTYRLLGRDVGEDRLPIEGPRLQPSLVWESPLLISRAGLEHVHAAS